MFNVVKTPLTLAAIAFLSAACSYGGGSTQSVPAAPVASVGSQAGVYTNAPTIQTAPVGSYAQPATYVSSQPTIYGTAPSVNYGAAQPALTQSGQFPAIGQTSIQPASTATFSSAPSYQAMPLQTPSYSVPNASMYGAQGALAPAQPSGSSLLQSGATAATSANAGPTAESLMIQGTNTAVNYGVDYGTSTLLAQ